jgi:hypothetical protein
MYQNRRKSVLLKAVPRSLRPALKWRMKKRSRMEGREENGEEKTTAASPVPVAREKGRRREKGEDNGARTEDDYSLSQQLISIVSLF